MADEHIDMVDVVDISKIINSHENQKLAQEAELKSEIHELTLEVMNKELQILKFKLNAAKSQLKSLK